MSTRGRVIRPHGLPAMYDYENYPQEVGSLTSSGMRIHPVLVFAGPPDTTVPSLSPAHHRVRSYMHRIAILFTGHPPHQAYGRM